VIANNPPIPPATAVAALLLGLVFRAAEGIVGYGLLGDALVGPGVGMPPLVDVLAAPGVALPWEVVEGPSEEEPVAAGGSIFVTIHTGSKCWIHVVEPFLPITESDAQVRCSASSVTFSKRVVVDTRPLSCRVIGGGAKTVDTCGFWTNVWPTVRGSPILMILDGREGLERRGGCRRRRRW